MNSINRPSYEGPNMAIIRALALHGGLTRDQLVEEASDFIPPEVGIRDYVNRPGSRPDKINLETQAQMGKRGIIVTAEHHMKKSGMIKLDGDTIYPTPKLFQKYPLQMVSQIKDETLRKAAEAIAKEGADVDPKNYARLSQGLVEAVRIIMRLDGLDVPIVLPRSRAKSPPANGQLPEVPSPEASAPS